MVIGVTLSILFIPLGAIWVGRTARNTDVETARRNDELRYLVDRNRIVDDHGLDDGPGDEG